MLGIVTSADVACGFHAGDPAGLLRVCRLASERGVRIHRSATATWPGSAGGSSTSRRRICSPTSYIRSARCTDSHRRPARQPSYVKPHGALYNTIVTNREQAAAVAQAVQLVDANLPGAVQIASAVRDRLKADGIDLKAFC
jgi:5-oxoprolinase (ATP-hydrolysing) subunit A